MSAESVPFWVLALKVFVVTVLILLNGFFVAAEFALVKVRDSQLRPLAQQGHRRAKIARLILGNLDSSLSACQLGITLASLGLGWIGEPVFAALLHPAMDVVGLTVDNIGPVAGRIRQVLAAMVGFGSLTFLHIVVGEQAPKWLAIQRPLPTALWVVEPLKWFHLISYPFIWVLNHSSLWFLRQLGLQAHSESESGHSDDELRILFTEAHKQRGATALGRAIVMNALDLKDRTARQVMRPRSEIAGMSTDLSIAECLELAEKTRFSRFPLTLGLRTSHSDPLESEFTHQTPVRFIHSQLIRTDPHSIATLGKTSQTLSDPTARRGNVLGIQRLTHQIRQLVQRQQPLNFPVIPAQLHHRRLLQIELVLDLPH